MRLVLVKLAGAVGSLLGLATVIFFMLKLVPGDEAVVAAGPGASQEQIAAIRVQLGLDRSVFVQYLAYLGRLLHGDLGTSTVSHSSVSQAVIAVLPSTAELVLLTVLITVVVALPLAALSVVRPGRGAVDTVRRAVVILAAGIPSFWLAIQLQQLLAARLGLLPLTGQLSEGFHVQERTGFLVIDALIGGQPLAAWDAIQHLLLPAIVLAVHAIGQVYRLTRAELLRVLQRDHVMVARAAGVPRLRLIRRHVLPHAVTPAIIIIAAEFGLLFGGALLVESVFGRPGLGSLMRNAIEQKDTAMVEGGVLVIGAIVIIANLAADLIQLARDPRIRVKQSKVGLA
jgi:peptide/nickel transport system permease protein